MAARGAIFFDVDGVLIDSLPPHLAICRAKAKQYHLDIRIPTENAFKSLLGTGVRISPMRYFFEAVGFPPNFAIKAEKDYFYEFQNDYRPKAFVDYDLVLKQLRNHDWLLGLVTANVKSNVIPAVANGLSFFEADCLFFHEEGLMRTKAQALLEGSKRLGFAPKKCYYVGDLLSDEDAAHQAGFNFVAAMYGWGLSQTEAQRKVYAITELLELFQCQPTTGSLAISRR